jgi:uncharacterized protein (DUF1800 family)
MRNRFLSPMLLSLGAFAAFTDARAQPNRELSTREQAAHAVSRLTFGARAGEVERVEAFGVDKWIAQQLKPAAIPDSGVSLLLASFPSWTLDARQLRAAASSGLSAAGAMMSEQRMAEGNMMGDTMPVRRVRRVSYVSPFNDFVAGKVIRAQLSERQLDEVMAEFWLNHFSVYSGKMPAAEAIVVWVREVIRPHTLGKFRDLVGAVAHSPAMLFYLDNVQNQSDSLHRSLTEFRAGATTPSRNAANKRFGLNENYARELLELHTLGVDGGYTQADVVDVARALTGWGLGPAAVGISQSNSVFRFTESQHDADEKTVLGHTLPEGRGIEDGEQVLDIIARHPSTARFIATKLARRFISDTPPSTVIDRAAATFTRTDHESGIFLSHGVSVESKITV